MIQICFFLGAIAIRIDSHIACLRFVHGPSNRNFLWHITNVIFYLLEIYSLSDKPLVEDNTRNTCIGVYISSDMKPTTHCFAYHGPQQIKSNSLEPFGRNISCKAETLTHDGTLPFLI